jgi:hypothetical protein
MRCDEHDGRGGGEIIGQRLYNKPKVLMRQSIWREIEEIDEGEIIERMKIILISL